MRRQTESQEATTRRQQAHMEFMRERRWGTMEEARTQREQPEDNGLVYASIDYLIPHRNCVDINAVIVEHCYRMERTSPSVAGRESLPSLFFPCYQTPGI